MVGNCVYLTIATLFLARVAGVELVGIDLAIVLFMIVVLSIGSAIAPGSVPMALTILLAQIGVSVVGIMLVLSLNVFMEMAMTMTNTFGDVATSLTLARTENLLDLQTFNSLKKR